MTDAHAHKKLSYIKKRKDVNFSKLMNQEIDLKGYRKAVKSFNKQIKELKEMDMFPNLRMKILKFEYELNKELKKLK